MSGKLIWDWNQQLCRHNYYCKLFNTSRCAHKQIHEIPVIFKKFLVYQVPTSQRKNQSKERVQEDVNKLFFPLSRLFLSHSYKSPFLACPSVPTCTHSEVLWYSATLYSVALVHERAFKVEVAGAEKLVEIKDPLKWTEQCKQFFYSNTFTISSVKIQQAALAVWAF